MITPKKPEGLTLSLPDSIKVLREIQIQLRFCDEGFGYMGAVYCEMLAGIASLAIDNIISALQQPQASFEQISSYYPHIAAIRLRELRHKANLSQQELADAIGVSKSCVNMYERGERRPKFNVLVHMSKIFDVAIPYLLGTN